MANHSQHKVKKKKKDPLRTHKSVVGVVARTKRSQKGERLERTESVSAQDRKTTFRQLMQEILVSTTELVFIHLFIFQVTRQLHIISLNFLISPSLSVLCKGQENTITQSCKVDTHKPGDINFQQIQS